MASPDLDQRRRDYAAEVLRLTGTANPRVEAAFARVPRERFLAPPPWTIFSPGGLFESTTSDPAELYRDALVVLDPALGLNNGQPSLHAAWLAMVDPRPGETAVHIGAGTGYYTAILAELVAPDGRVEAYEVDPRLAAVARANLASAILPSLGRVTLHAGSAIGADLPPADVVYVNTGLAAPDPAWLIALKPNGRSIFPWQPRPPGGITLKVTRVGDRFAVLPSLHVGFVPCVGDPARAGAEKPNEAGLARTRSLWLARDRAPDGTATAVYPDVWFSSEPVEVA